MKKYGGIQPGELERLRSELHKSGVNAPEGDDVTLEGPHNVFLRARYDRQRETLTVTITDKPFWVPQRQIWEIVDQAVGGFVDE